MVFDTILVKTERKITDTMSEQTKAYRVAVMKAGACGLICGLITHYSDKILATLLEANEMQNPMEKCEACRAARLVSTYQQSL